jgi:hypothetical protein
LFFSTASAFGSPADSASLAKPTTVPGGKPTTSPGGKPPVTPGAKATEHAAQPKGKRATYRGTVAAVGDASLTLTLADASSLTFAVTNDTRINVPTAGHSATLADVNTGVPALIQAAQAGDGTLTALHVIIIPGKPTRIHRVGIVTAYSAGASITIQDKDGNTDTFVLTVDTKILPEARAGELAVGSRVTIISRRDVTGGPAAAQGIVVQPSGTGAGGAGTPQP